jgi:hypothetical protein
MAERQQAFVEATAQIIPVLVLALLADPAGRTARAGHSGLILFALIAGLFGESIALLAVAIGTDKATNWLIVISMLVLSLAIIAPHATQHWGNVVKNVPRRWRYVMQQVFYYVSGTPFILLQISNLPGWAETVMWICFAVTVLLTIRYDLRKFRTIKSAEAQTAHTPSLGSAPRELVPRASESAQQTSEERDKGKVAPNRS